MQTENSNRNLFPKNIIVLGKLKNINRNLSKK